MTAMWLSTTPWTTLSQWPGTSVSWWWGALVGRGLLVFAGSVLPSSSVTLLWIQYNGHFVCGLYPLLEPACTNTYFTGLWPKAMNFVMLTGSYVIIFHFVTFRSVQRRHNSLSTCGAYFTVISLHIKLYVPIIILLIRKNMVVLFGILTTMLNLLIYTLRNEEVKNRH